jgi:hypothetical protein
MRSGLRTGLRILTSLGIFVFSSACLLKGWEIVQFSLAQANAAATTTDQAKAFGPWADTPGVATLALERLLPRIKIGDNNLAAIIARRDQLLRYLSVRPLSSSGWLSLAEDRLSTGQPMDKVRSSLFMSALTGPHEGEVMVNRAMFGLTIWPLLSPDLKRRIANDLTETLPKLGYLSTTGQLRLQSILSRKNKTEAESIKEALLASGLTPIQLTTIGL